MAILAVSGLRKSYGGVRALDGVSFSVEAGEMVAIIGPNGAGKSTCFNLVNGQLAADAGEVFFEGKSIRGAPPHLVWRLGVGRTFQVAAAFGSMTVRENLQVALLSHARKLGAVLGRASDACLRESDDLLAGTSLRERATSLAAELAYGDLKRVELALALANRPRLLLMDEPTAGMAATERENLMRQVRQLTREDRLAVLFTEHDMEVVFGFADRVLVLHNGALIAQGPPEAVRADPRVREVYLGAA